MPGFLSTDQSARGRSPDSYVITPSWETSKRLLPKLAEARGVLIGCRHPSTPASEFVAGVPIGGRATRKCCPVSGCLTNGLGPIRGALSCFTSRLKLSGLLCLEKSGVEAAQVKAGVLGSKGGGRPWVGCKVDKRLIEGLSWKSPLHASLLPDTALPAEAPWLLSQRCA